MTAARGVRDEAALRARRLPGPRRLREEHDHRRGADGRRDPGGVGGGRPDAADARAHPARVRSASRDGGVPEQGRPGGRPGAARAGRAGAPRAVVVVRLSGDEIPIIKGSALQALDEPRTIGERAEDRRADRGGGRLHSGAGAGDRQGVPDADRGHLLDLGPRHGGDRAGWSERGSSRWRGGGDRGHPPTTKKVVDRRRDVQASFSTRARRATTWGCCCVGRTDGRRARPGDRRSRARSRRTRSSRARCTC